jgi:cell division protease FtsH
VSDISKIKKYKWIKNVVLAVGVVAIVSAGFIYSNREVPKAQPVSKFLQDIDAKKVKKVEISTDFLNESLVIYLKDEKAKPYTVVGPRFGMDTASDLVSKGVEVDYPPAGTDYSKIANHFLTLMIIGYLGFMIVQMMPGGFHIGLKRKEKEKTKFTDVAGAEEAKAAMEEVVDYLKNPKDFEKWGARFPSGVILCGPPGNGKTLLARAVAGEAGAEFISASPADFTSPFIGVAGMKINRLFSRARAKAPCVVFIDEIDSIGGARMSEGTAAAREMGSTLTQLLVQLDGFEPNSGVIVIAATNRVESLDPALLRSGRFDRHIKVHSPNLSEREAILKIHAKDIPLDETFDFTEIARASTGMSGADLANLMNQAALIGKKQGVEKIAASQAIAARDRMLMGERRLSTSKILSDQTKRILAYHEASHAVVAKHFDFDEVTAVSIMPRGLSLGQTLTLPATDGDIHDQKYLLGQLSIFAAGRHGELMFCSSCSTGAANDIERMTDIAQSMVYMLGMSELGMVKITDRSKTSLQDRAASAVLGLIGRAELTAKEVLHKNQDVVHVLAKKLIDDEEVSGDELKQILSKTHHAETLAKDAHSDHLEA